MAKRRTLVPPSLADINRVEEEFRRETSLARPTMAPIAAVAAEAAAAADPRPTHERLAAARDHADANAWREAQGQGLVMLELPIDGIDADALVRDRSAIGAEEMEELKLSIAKNGLRLPIEVFTLPGGGYGLLSGYRRLMAVRALKALSGDPRHDRIRAVLRDPETMGGPIAAMVEENEVRAGLSQYERGRIAVLAVQQGAFANVEAAVDALFPVASKAKRSKIRSFALVFEELGDMLAFPEQLREKDGLRLAAALRDGAEGRLRESLALHSPASAAEEAVHLDKALAALVEKPADPSRGGRPKREPTARHILPSGLVIEAHEEAKGWSIRIGGATADRDLVLRGLRDMAQLLERA
ncbi:ParB/RepB/Spo0J family partition protein [Xinfangfangia sp. D13-10-4-6]|uniref:ParB/RepB/Spo0J family partition protein n=1 Tax=Pseudogemmobacter hezensis TaxID=2737662 RepID=UPI0015527E0D|nr:ParB/RepB/Spo0J family partition protein [Pseudogemmobacter hezensis]NPD15985.1 ParB/RepB/Spo0J family partition protein [Pseudogemmobacter hezensis]